METRNVSMTTYNTTTTTRLHFDEQLWDAYVNQAVVDADWNTPYTEIAPAFQNPLTEAMRSPTPSPVNPLAVASPMFPSAAYMTREPSALALPASCQTEDDGVVPSIFTTHLRMQTRSVRAKNKARENLRQKPLHETHTGVAILKLLTLRWYAAESGLACTQIPQSDSEWMTHDLVNYLNWLDVGIHAHRSAAQRIVCVENLQALNAVYALNDTGPIVVREPPSRWPKLIPVVRNNRRVIILPLFMRRGFRSSYQPAPVSYVARSAPLEFIHHTGRSESPNFRAAALERQGPGQAATPLDADAPRPESASPAPAERDDGGWQQNGNRFLYGVDAQRTGQDADAKPRWEPVGRPLATSVSTILYGKPDA